MKIREIERLSPAAVRNAKPPSRGRVLLPDGYGLYLQVSRSKVTDRVLRSWLFRYQLHGQKTHDMGLGPLATVSLDEARERAAAARKLVRDGTDPINHRNAKISDASSISVCCIGG